MVRKIFFTIAALCIFPAYSLAGAYPDITIVENSARGIAFTYSPTGITWTDSGAVADHAATLHREGYPSVPGRIVYVALPPGSRTVQVAARGVRDNFRRGATARSLSAALIARGVDLYPPDRVVVDGVFSFKGIRVARLILHPVLIAAAGGEAGILESMTVSLAFDRAAPSAAAASSLSAQLIPVAFRRVLDEMLINPAQGLSWQTSDQSLAATVAETSPFAGATEWYAIRTTSDGIVALTYNDLDNAGVDVRTADPRQFRLFTGDGRQLSTTMSEPGTTLGEVAIRIDGAADGVFDRSDSLFFYAQALNRSELTDDGDLIDVVNRYDTENVYWLTPGGNFSNAPLRIAAIPSLSPDDAEVTVLSSPTRQRFEDELLFRVGTFATESYYTWYWRNLETSGLSFPGLVNVEPGSTARLTVSTFAGTAGREPAQLRVDGTTVPRDAFSPWALEDRTSLTEFVLPNFRTSAAYVLDLTGGAASNNHYLDFYAVTYQRGLDLAFGPQKFIGPDTTATVGFVVGNAVGARIWDITDHRIPMEITGAVASGAVARFAVATVAGAQPVFYAQRAGVIFRPASITAAAPEDIHTVSAPVDYLVIGPREFAAASAEFLNYRAGTDGLAVRYVATEDIYAGFSGGLTDPVAIRRFLRHAHFNWPKPVPGFVLLMGDGSHDFIDNTGVGSVNFVPPYITAEDNAVSDERYAYLSDEAVLNAERPDEIPDEPLPDYIVGRWPVRIPDEIAALTAKIKRYESSEDLGPWRSRVMVVADDEYGDRSANPPAIKEVIHGRDAERITNGTIPARFDLRKIYLTEFPFDNPGCTAPGAQGCRKPAAKEAIITGLNEGVAVYDFIGHGNMDLMAHERVLERATDLPRLTNAGRATAVVTFSCSIGFFDHPSREGMAEEWLRMPTGGAVSAIAATRLSRAVANAELNEEFFDLLFQQGMNGIGEALYTAKLLRQYHDPVCALSSGCPDGPPCPCDNDRGYMLLGDPAMKLGIPLRGIAFDQMASDSLTALSPVHVEAGILDEAGNLDATFDGEVFVSVRDVPRDRNYRVGDTDSILYKLPGGILYRGRATVTAGRFAVDFIVPKDVGYGRQGARILAHAVGGDAMAAGAVDSLWIAGTAGPLTDTTGPAIAVLSASGELVVDGFTLESRDTLIVRLDDPSGINLTGATGHRPVVTTNLAAEPLVDLTERFVYDPGTAERGEARIDLSDLEPGPVTLEVRAWDNANNSSVLAIVVDITAEGGADEFAVTEFLPYPNPLADQTTFYFRATRAIEEATIRIFTVAGRLIWEGRNLRDGAAIWDGTDHTGERVANGVYLAQLAASGRVAEGGDLVDKTAYMETKLVVSR